MKKLLSVIFAACLELCVSAQQYLNPIIDGYEHYFRGAHKTGPRIFED